MVPNHLHGVDVNGRMRDGLLGAIIGCLENVRYYDSPYLLSLVPTPCFLSVSPTPGSVHVLDTIIRVPDLPDLGHEKR